MQKVFRYGTDLVSRCISGSRIIVSAVLNNSPPKCVTDMTMEEIAADLAERLKGTVDGATFKGYSDGKPYTVDLQITPKKDSDREEKEL